MSADPDPLTAAFEGVPETHDGSAFSFRVAFNEAVTASAADLRSAFTVSGGQVSAASLVDGETATWTVTVTPDGEGEDVTVALPETTDCAADGALCTAGGGRLEDAVSATVRLSQTPFLPSFDRVPSEHDGTAFELDLQLGKDPGRLGYRKVQNQLLNVTGGTVTKAKRLERGNNQGWQLTVTPDSTEDVEIAVRTATSCNEAHAVCTAGGQLLEGGLQVTVRGLAQLSVADAEVHEGPGAVLEFVVTLDRRRFEATTVEYATADGTATAGADHTATSGTLTIARIQTSATISVPVLDDSIDEGAETMTLTLSNPDGARIDDGTATGTINNSDPMPQAWISRFGRTVGAQVVDAVTGRLDAGTETHVTVGGMQLGRGGTLEALETREHTPGEWVRQNRSQNVTPEDLLLGSSFHLSAGGGETGGPVFTGWGHFATSGFEAQVDDLRLDGDVTSGLLGFDAEWNRVVAGALVSQSKGDGAYNLALD